MPERVELQHDSGKQFVSVIRHESPHSAQYATPSESRWQSGRGQWHKRLRTGFLRADSQRGSLAQ